ncbi:MAG: TolC family protein [Planctomycetes bacterium]|nr:TolC family protein [Planctomycetota bacterium]
MTFGSRPGRSNFAHTLALVTSVLVAGCRAAPEPVDSRALDDADRRFQSTSPAAAAAAAPPGSPSAKTGNGAGGDAPSAPVRARVEELLSKEQLTLDEVLAIVDARNPTLAAERENVDLATALIWEARLYPNPTFLCSIEDYKTKDRRAFDHSTKRIGVGIPVVVGGRIGAASAVAEKERQLAAIAYVWRRREVLTEAKRAFVNLLSTRRALELAKETRAIAADFNRVATERYNVAAIPQMEVLKSDVYLAGADIDVRVAEKNAVTAQQALHALLGDAQLAADRFEGELSARFTPPALAALGAEAGAGHPLVEAARRARESAELQLEQARAERMPDPEVEVMVGRDGDNDSLAQVGLAVPLPLFNRNQGRIAAAEAKIRQADFKLRATENDLRRQLGEAHREFVAAQERARAYGDEMLPKAQISLELTTEGYRQGKFGYLDVLDAQRTLAEAKLSYATALADLNLAAADLEKLAGMRLEAVK